MIDLTRDVSLLTWSSFRTPSTAQFAAHVRTPAELQELLGECARRGLPTTVLGGGTNVVLLDQVRGCVIHNGIRGITARAERGISLVTAGAGDSWHSLVRYCVAQGLSGIENLALIPGTVGGAPIQNIGAYGMELSRTLRQVAVVERATGHKRVLAAQDCELEYRDSAFKGRWKDKYVITSITLALAHRFEAVLGYPDVANEMQRSGARTTLANVAEAVIRVRRRKLPDPRTLGNAGSFFKNPVLTGTDFERVRALLPHLPERPVAGGFRVPAAALIDACGLKGLRRGAVGVWPRQPLVLVNHGGARGSELLVVADEIRDHVHTRFGVRLELEPIVIGSSR